MKSISELLEFGIINIDKSTGPTSFSVGQFVKKELGLKKTSHLGTLDPMVTGVLPIALNRACRLSEFLMHRDKEYVGIMRLHSDVSENKLKEEMKKFVGKIIQLPPVRSRVKRAEREREVKKFEIIERDGKDVLFIAEVQAGMYIRKICSDLGDKIGGAHMLELRRIRAGEFDEEKIYDLYEFEKAVDSWKKGDESLLREMIVSGEIVLKKVMPSVQIKEEVLKQILVGKPLMKPDLKEDLPKENIFAVYCGEQFVAVMKKVDEPRDLDYFEGDIVGRAEFVKN